MFNHSSPRRGETFVTRRISRAVAAIAVGNQEELHLGNLDAVRDWGYAGEYVEAMWFMLRQPEPRDYIVATGRGYSIRDFLRFSFQHVGLECQDYVRFDERYLRPSEVVELIGDAARTRELLDWEPRIYAPELARVMVGAVVPFFGGRESPSPTASWPPMQVKRSRRREPPR